jgi:hypothetical protein
MDEFDKIDGYKTWFSGRYISNNLNNSG